MVWAKGQSGNPGGRPKQSSEVTALAKKEAPAAFKKLIRMANGKPAVEGGDVPNNRELLRAQEMLFDRAWGRAPAPDSAVPFAGVTILVDTGIRRTPIEPPTIDITPEAKETPAVNGKTKPD